MGAGLEQRRGIVEQPETGHQAIAAAVGRIGVQRAGKVFVFVVPLALKTGQVWVRTLIELGKAGLLCRPVLPAEAAEQKTGQV